MNGGSNEELLAGYFQDLIGTPPSLVSVLWPHASERCIYRLCSSGFSCIGVIHRVKSENEAFVAFAKHFKAALLPVPEIYLYAPPAGIYLQQDLGDVTLLDILQQQRQSSADPFPPKAEALYKTALEFLPRFQIEAGSTVDFTKCLSSGGFCSDALVADIACFTRELVLRLLPAYDIGSLDGDFGTLIAFLAHASDNFFLYRDFQSRNIMIVADSPWFIDFQGGHKGPLQYDLVSLLYQSSAKIPQTHRSALLNHYLDHVQNHTKLDRHLFVSRLGGFIVSRMIQVLGVYGREGLGAGKQYFLASIPTALDTLYRELRSDTLGLSLPHLVNCTDALIDALRGCNPT